MFIFVMLSFLVIICWENADLSLVCYVCFFYFPIWCYRSGIRHLIVLMPDLCLPLYFICVKF